MIGCGAHYREEQRPSHLWVTLIQIKNLLLFLQRSTLPCNLLCIASYIASSKPPEKGFQMNEQFRIGDRFQKVGKENFDAVVRACGEANKSLQAIAAELTDYSKSSVEDATRAFQQLVSAKSVEQAFEIQSQYAKKAYDAYIAEVSKLGEMWVDLARDTYQPVERAISK